jgi:hypothetical protein
MEESLRKYDIFFWFRKLFSESTSEERSRLVRPVNRQIKAWNKANRKMGWGITNEEFDKIGELPQLTESELQQGYIGAVLFCGFGDDGFGNADSVLSGKMAWDYAIKRKKKKAWHCEYIHFDKPDHMRLRPEAPPRPKGFYYGKLQFGERYLLLTVSKVRKSLRKGTGCGPEGIQFLAITHTHFQEMMDERKIPFMALADYDVAPYGFNDFFDAPQLFYRDGVLGLGIGNIDHNYPLFGIPTIILPEQGEST